jgi:hypothetical protein
MHRCCAKRIVFFKVLDFNYIHIYLR